MFVFHGGEEDSGEESNEEEVEKEHHGEERIAAGGSRQEAEATRQGKPAPSDPAQEDHRRADAEATAEAEGDDLTRKGRRSRRRVLEGERRQGGPLRATDVTLSARQHRRPRWDHQHLLLS